MVVDTTNRQMNLEPTVALFHLSSSMEARNPHDCSSAQNSTARQKLVGVLGKRLSETDHSKAKPFKQHHRLQQQQQQGQRQQRCYTPEMGEHDLDKSSSLPARALSSGKQQHRPRRSKVGAIFSRTVPKSFQAQVQLLPSTTMR